MGECRYGLGLYKYEWEMDSPRQEKAGTPVLVPYRVTGSYSFQHRNVMYGP